MRVSDIIESIEGCLTETSFEDRVAVDRLRRAHKFVINVSDEALATALDYARQLDGYGILGLPFPETYFEFRIVSPGTQPSVAGVLCWSEGGQLLGRMYGIRQNVEFCPALCTFEIATNCPSAVLSPTAKANRRAWTDFRSPNEEKALSLFATSAQKVADLAIDLALAAIGSLTLRGAEAVTHRPDPALNRARIKRGREPFDSHVTITVKTDPGQAGAVGSSFFERNGPRLHWRRGHIRRLPTGGLTQVRPCLVGDRSIGSVTHDYLVA